MREVGILRVERLPLGDGDLVAEHAIEPLEERGLDRSSSGDSQPVERVKERHERVQGSGHLGDFGEDVGGAVRLGDLGVREPLDDLHGRGRPRGPRERSPKEQAALLVRPSDRGLHPSAEQAVAAAEMMIQKAQRSTDGEGVEPQRDLGQLHRHRVLVHPVDAPLEHHAADDVAVVELARIEGPAPVLRVVHDRVADPLDPLGERRQVSLHERLGLGHRLDEAVGDVVHKVDEEVPGAHRGIADLEFERSLRRIEPLQTAHAPVLRDLARSEIRRLGGEGVHPGVHQRPDGLPDDQIDQIVGRVVAARVLAGEHVRTDHDVPILADHLPF